MQYDKTPGWTVYGDAKSWKAPIEWTAKMHDRAFMKGMDGVASKKVRRRAHLAEKKSERYRRVLGMTNLFLLMSLGRGCAAFESHFEMLRRSWGLAARPDVADDDVPVCGVAETGVPTP